MLAQSVYRVKLAKLSLQSVTSRSPASHIAAKIDASTINDNTSDYANAAPFSSIPGPSVLSLVVSNLPGGKYYKKDMREVTKMLRNEYGDLLRVPSIFGKPPVVLSHKPEHFQTIFRTEGQWPERSGLDTIQYFREKVRPDVFGKYPGLLNTQGKQWGDFRTAVNPVMIQPKTAKLYIPVIDEVAGEFLQRIRQIRNPSTNQLPENFEDEMNKWTLESIGVVALDTRLGLLSGKTDERAIEFMRAVKQFFVLLYEFEFKPSLWRIFPTPSFNKFMKTLDTMTTISLVYIKEAKAKLEAKPTNSTGEQSVLEKLLKTNENIATVMAMDMIFAGVDTTSSAFTGSLYLLAKNPDKQQLLREELMTVLAEKNSTFTVEKMRHLPYLRACLKEAHRITPTTNGNLRGAGQDLVIDGYQIPKGTQFVMSGTPLQQEDKYYPDAQKFIPKRWLKQASTEEKCPASMKSAHPFIYLPFGFGPRMCIGRRFAEMEIEIMIAKIIRNFYVSWEHDDLKFKSAAINLPNAKLMFTLKDVEK